MKTSATICLLAAATVGSSTAFSAEPSPVRNPNAAIKVAANGMSLLKPIFGAEAKLQAAILGGNVDPETVAADIAAAKKANKALIYTYGLSPFSTEAVAILEASGYEFENIELGAEWFALGGYESVARVELSKEVESGATSLPKIFIGGNCIGGCAELAALAESGELDSLMASARVPKKGAAAKKGAFSFFG